MASSTDIIELSIIKQRCRFWFIFKNISLILSCKLVSFLAILFFHTNVYLLADASIFVPSINILSNSISLSSPSFFINWLNKFSMHPFNLLLLNLAIELCPGGCWPCKSHLKFISLLHAFSRARLEYIPSIYP